MPHRIHIFSHTLSNLLEFAVLGVATVIAGLNQLLDEESWDRLTGRHGALFFMSIALLIFWNSNRVTNKRNAAHLEKQEVKEDIRRREEESLRQSENASRELRHKEAMALQQANADKLMALSAESIKSQLKFTQAITELKTTLDGRPCGMKNFTTPTP